METRDWQIHEPCLLRSKGVRLPALSCAFQLFTIAQKLARDLVMRTRSTCLYLLIPTTYFVREAVITLGHPTKILWASLLSISSLYPIEGLLCSGAGHSRKSPLLLARDFSFSTYLGQSIIRKVPLRSVDEAWNFAFTWVPPYSDNVESK